MAERTDDELLRLADDSVDPMGEDGVRPLRALYQAGRADGIAQERARLSEFVIGLQAKYAGDHERSTTVRLAKCDAFAEVLRAIYPDEAETERGVVEQ